MWCVKEYKNIFHCPKCKKETTFSYHEFVICECGCDEVFTYYSHLDHFMSEDEYQEHLYFKDWEDDSSGNYVGYLLKLKDYNIIVSRESAAKSGLYGLTICSPKIRSNSDSFGEKPELFKNTTRNLNLDSVKKIINFNLRREKIQKIKYNEL